MLEADHETFFWPGPAMPRCLWVHQTVGEKLSGRESRASRWMGGVRRECYGCVSGHVGLFSFTGPFPG